MMGVGREAAEAGYPAGLDHGRPHCLPQGIRDESSFWRFMCDMGRYQGLQKNPWVAKMPRWGRGSGEISEGLGQNGNKPGLSQTNWDNCSPGLVSECCGRTPPDSEQQCFFLIQTTC